MKLIEAAEKTEQRRKEEKLLHYAREGKAEEVTKLVRFPIFSFSNIVVFRTLAAILTCMRVCFLKTSLVNLPSLIVYTLGSIYIPLF